MEYKPIRPPKRIQGYANRMRKSPTRHEQMVRFALNWTAENDPYVSKFLSIIKNQFCFYYRRRNK